MSTTFTSKIKALTVVANFLNLPDAVIELRALRMKSDIMEIIGHPRNPNNALLRDAATIEFEKFRKKYGQVELDILNTLEERTDLATARQVAQICLSDKDDKEKLSELTQYLEEHVPQTTSSYRI